MSNGDNAVHVSSGVEALIQRLRDEGVESGRAQAEKIVADAETRAGWILKQAEEDARTHTQAGQAGGRPPAAVRTRGPECGGPRRAADHEGAAQSTFCR